MRSQFTKIPILAIKNHKSLLIQYKWWRLYFQLSRACRKNSVYRYSAQFSSFRLYFFFFEWLYRTLSKILTRWRPWFNKVLASRANQRVSLNIGKNSSDFLPSMSRNTSWVTSCRVSCWPWQKPPTERSVSG